MRLERIVIALVIAALSVAPLHGQRRHVTVAELTPEAETAIRSALIFLAARQQPDGSFSDKHEVAVTALSIMAFMLQGHQPGVGLYGPTLDRAIAFLVLKSRQGKHGYMGKSMYEHALATLALSEAWGMSDNDQIRPVLKRAVNLILTSQHATGGWRYKPEPIDHDLSVTAMQVMALVSAQEAGILVPSEIISRAVGYARSCRFADGRFGYQPNHKPSVAMTAAGAMCLMMTGHRDDPAVTLALDRLAQTPQRVFEREQHYHYTHYYAVQAMYQAGDDYFHSWYPKIHDVLIARQQPMGYWTSDQGDEYATAMNVLILGVPYRFLPIYQR